MGLTTYKMAEKYEEFSIFDFFPVQRESGTVFILPFPILRACPGRGEGRGIHTPASGRPLRRRELPFIFPVASVKKIAFFPQIMG